MISVSDSVDVQMLTMKLMKDTRFSDNSDTENIISVMKSTLRTQ